VAAVDTWSLFILLAAFARADPTSAKNTVKPSVFFALLGSTRLIGACKMLVKSTPGFIHLLRINNGVLN